jgi:hypothetical protein
LYEPIEHAPPAEDGADGGRREGKTTEVERGGVDERKEDEEGLVEEGEESEVADGY